MTTNEQAQGTAVRQSAFGAFVVTRASDPDHPFTVLAEGELEDYGFGELGRDGAVRNFRERRGIADNVRVDIVPDDDPQTVHMFPPRPIRLEIDVATITTRPQLVCRAVAQMLLDYANGHTPNTLDYGVQAFRISEGEPVNQPKES